jgi:heat shock protein 4
METDAPAGEEAPPKKTRLVKKQIKKGDLPVVSGTASIDPEVKAHYNERENQMVMEDKLVADTEDRKNHLEEYIYETRGKIDDIYAPFASEKEREAIKAALEAAEVRCYPIHKEGRKLTGKELALRGW